MLARAVSTAFATPAAAPNTASPPGSARSRPGSARHVASPTRSDRPLPGPHAQVDGRSAAHMPSQPRSAALRQPVARQRPSVDSDQGAIDARPAFMARRAALEPRSEPACGPPPARHAACQPPAPTAQGPPAPLPRPPAQLPAGRGTRAHTCGRACGVEFSERKSESGAGAPCKPRFSCPGRITQLHIEPVALR